MSFFMLFGAAIICIGVKMLNEANESKGWQTVVGKVIGSSIQAKRFNTGSSSSRGGITYHADVRYEYVVDGLTQSSTEISAGDYGSSDPSHARQVAKQYPVGREVTVHYSPENPAKAVLQAGNNDVAKLVIVFGVFFIGFALAMFICAPEYMQRARESV